MSLKAPPPPPSRPARPSLTSLTRFNAVVLVGFLLASTALYLYSWLEDIVLLLVGTAVTAYLLQGLVNTIQKFLKPIGQKIPGKFVIIGSRPMAVLLTYFLLLLTLALFFVRVVPALRDQVIGLSEVFPRQIHRLEGILDKVTRQTMQQMPRLPGPVASPQPPSSGQTAESSMPSHPIAGLPAVLEPGIARKQAKLQMLDVFNRLGKTLFGSLVDVGTSTLSGALYVLTGLVLVFYLLVDGNSLKLGFVRLLPAGKRQSVQHFLERIHPTLSHFVQVRIILAFLSCLVLLGVYSLLGIEYAGFLSLTYGFCSLIPVIGPWLGVMPGLIVVLLTNQAELVPFLLAFVGFFFLVKEGMLLPWLRGTQTTVHPVIIILVTMMCIRISGLWGLLIAFPLVGLLDAIVRWQESET